ncbi:hypothetical protein DDB_G0272142 [Dictyostelium discoideum AX4]|uniref:Prokaryotic-type class I peptide chain release factors domain-containing protein n=1 Tax=Dictyostelium discoideum TaxID=44689 RepID=Q86JL2_DICDI|nr:hypothetical protein DDB_G0272142 [Dictyostelium discoideum AX4]EAL71223.1 hypothetical protein DDB_G0272142 [Dictyostelium discoideum AX4]|eukprot:XP_645206.1 hypothetical protein DDB_G0272142 [Dictyostelium discoideum AX4]
MNKVNILKSLISVNTKLNNLNNYYSSKLLSPSSLLLSSSSSSSSSKFYYIQRNYSDTHKDKKEKYYNNNNNNNEPPPPKIIVPKEKLNLQFSRSSGAGGQNVNKVNTKVEVRFDLNKADWIPPYVKVNMRNVNDDDEFIITSSKHRYQHLNINDAMDKLDDILKDCQIIEKERIATEIPSYANERRLHDKSIKKEIKQSRKKPSFGSYFD